MIIRHYIKKSAMVMSGLVLYGLANAASSATPDFIPELDAHIEDVTKAFLLAHPEVLVEVSEKLQAQQQDQQMKALTAAVLQQQNALLNDQSTPSYAPWGAKVTVAEFFDYQCVVCARQAPVIESVMKANPQVRYVFKEWPIFAQRWTPSLTAAETGRQVWKQKVDGAYLAYPDLLKRSVPAVAAMDICSRRG